MELAVHILGLPFIDWIKYDTAKVYWQGLLYPDFPLLLVKLKWVKSKNLTL